MSYLESKFCDCNRNDEIMLEPKLLEYLRKKKYYQQNGIEIEFLDQEFNITKQDMLKIRAYLRGDDGLYSTNNAVERHDDLVDLSKAKFPSEDFKKDDRFKRVEMKQKKEADADLQRKDYNIISKSYDMYRKDLPFASAYGNDFRKTDFHPNDWFKDSRDEMPDPDIQFDIAQQVEQQRSFAQSNTYTNPKSRYNGYLSDRTIVNDDRHCLDSIIGNLESYRKQVSRQPNRDRHKEESENNYTTVPLRQNGSRDFSSRDMDVDNYMRLGTTPLRGGKSLGYPSVAEHSFSYISPDIQCPDNVVSSRGIASRSYNKEMARPMIKRDVMR